MLTNQAVFSADGQSIMYIDETSKVVMVIGMIVCSLSLRSHHFLKANSKSRLVAPQKKTQNKFLLELFDLEVKVVFIAGHVKLNN